MPLPPIDEVETHQVTRLAPVDTTLALAELAPETRIIRDIHDVRVRETDQGEIVNFHCRVDPALSVGAVHDAVDALERRLRRRFPLIQRVIGHAEPRQ